MKPTDGLTNERIQTRPFLFNLSMIYGMQYENTKGSLSGLYSNDPRLTIHERQRYSSLMTRQSTTPKFNILTGKKYPGAPFLSISLWGTCDFCQPCRCYFPSRHRSGSIKALRVAYQTPTERSLRWANMDYAISTTLSPCSHEGCFRSNLTPNSLSLEG